MVTQPEEGAMSQNLPPAGPPPPPPGPPPSGYPSYGYGYGYGYPPPMISKTNGSAIGALVCGLISMLMPVLLSIPAIILGIVGLRAINVSNGVEKGKGMAISGIVLGSLTLLGTILLIIIATTSQS